MFHCIKRTIMIFPEFSNIKYINELRGKYDPLANKVRPHITAGQFRSLEEANNAYEKERNFDKIFTCLADRISVEIIGNDAESIIESEYFLQQK